MEFARSFLLKVFLLVFLLANLLAMQNGANGASLPAEGEGKAKNRKNQEFPRLQAQMTRR